MRGSLSGWLASKSTVPAPSPAAATNQLTVLMGTTCRLYRRVEAVGGAHLLRVAAVVPDALLVLDHEGGDDRDDGGFGANREADPPEDAARPVRIAPWLAAVAAAGGETAGVAAGGETAGAAAAGAAPVACGEGPGAAAGTGDSRLAPR